MGKIRKTINLLSAESADSRVLKGIPLFSKEIGFGSWKVVFQQFCLALLRKRQMMSLPDLNSVDTDQTAPLRQFDQCLWKITYTKVLD